MSVYLVSRKPGNQEDNVIDITAKLKKIGETAVKGTVVAGAGIISGFRAINKARKSVAITTSKPAPKKVLKEWTPSQKVLAVMGELATSNWKILKIEGQQVSAFDSTFSLKKAAVKEVKERIDKLDQSSKTRFVLFQKEGEDSLIYQEFNKQTPDSRF